MEPLAWVIVLALTAVAVVAGVREERRARRQRRSVVAGREVRYGRGTGYRPRSALWTGLLLAWFGTNVAVLLLFLPVGWRPAAITAIAAILLAALYFLLDYARTDVVEGRVLERKILYSGEDNSTTNYWIAVDDGRPGRISGTPVSRDDYARVAAGAQVRLHLTPRGRQLKRLEILELPAPAHAIPTDLWITPAQAATALASPVEFVPVPPDVPNTRRYLYVPPGTPVTNGTTLPPALHVTEAYDPEAAEQVAHRAGRSAWRHGDRGVVQAGATYLLSWGRGALVLRGHVDVNDGGGIGRLAYGLRPPR
ncbi:hypothetical protein [Paractinoplanes rishiriensis]|uniref:hypothetical protein n=1 Tax=Paractinoplanes rishiriensis TaxID=1050105 RepID=UPI0019441111|nr:hypothetical protein [Actinoplanes rishiriensis]